ncbi:ead/Ea22-like family protein [Salmonella enterica]|nr:ead/Ea22-like family protein [Salmonella enterica]EEM0243722.1 ead/Ea22-like family protein [Salmonella enterica subsp. enterica serovar Brandenburg]
MTIDKQALREAAEKATKGPYVVGHNHINQHGNLSGVYVCQQWKDSAGGVVAECHVNCLTKTSEQVYANAEFIAVANPRTMLALLDELEAAEKHIAELEARTVVVKQFDDFQIVHYGATEDYAKGYIDCQSNYNKAIYAAGIKVKGE